MNKELWVTKSIPEQATILLVDVQEKYFQEGDQSERIERRIHDRLKRMEARLNGFKAAGHTIYAIVDEDGIHPKLEGIAHGYLPTWSYQSIFSESIDPAERYILHPQIIETLSTASEVVVCGLWRELCVYTVTRLLQKENINAYLSIDSDISLENAMVWEDDDNITLEDECEAYGVEIKTN